jgi:hypothetical protein
LEEDQFLVRRRKNLEAIDEDIRRKSAGIANPPFRIVRGQEEPSLPTPEYSHGVRATAATFFPRISATVESNPGGTPELDSVFISYGGPDQRLAEMLRNKLVSEGIRTFLFSTDAMPGEKIHHVMREGINRYDRVLLLCSHNSLDRPGVLNELEETLQREAREGGSKILIPVALDDYLYSDWSPNRPEIAQSVRDRVYADFRDEHMFDASFRRLVAALKRSK